MSYQDLLCRFSPVLPVKQPVKVQTSRAYVAIGNGRHTEMLRSRAYAPLPVLPNASMQERGALGGILWYFTFPFLDSGANFTAATTSILYAAFFDYQTATCKKIYCGKINAMVYACARTQ